MLKVTILVDNSADNDKYVYAEPGFSAWIECGGEKILFDTGYSDVLVKNAQMLGIDLCSMNRLVYSHGHYDHTWGTHALLTHFMHRAFTRSPALTAHPLVFENKRHKDTVIGAVITEERLRNYFDVTLSAEPAEIAKDLWWLGEIPASVTTRVSLGERENGGKWEDDFCFDDSALAWRGRDGVVIITGCSHSGICNIAAHAKKVTGCERIADIIGGFHLLHDKSAEVEKVSSLLRDAGVSRIHPCHCTGQNSVIALSRNIEVVETRAGYTFCFE